MSLVRQSNPVAVNISNAVFGESKIKRKAVLQNLVYSPEKFSVSIDVKIVPYAVASGDTYGAQIVSNNVNAYRKMIVADMSQLVDSQTGAILGAAKLVNDPKATQVGGPLFGKDYSFEFEFYNNIAATQPVIIHQLIIAKIQEADAEGKL